MNARSVLLVESVEAAGAAARDARTRARTLLQAGCEVRCAVIEPLHAAHLDAVPGTPGDGLIIQADPHGRRLLREWIGESPADLVLVASAIEGGGEAGRWVERFPGIKAWWWPTGLCGRRHDTDVTDANSTATMGSMLRPGPLRALRMGEPGRPVQVEPWPGACAGLEASVLPGARPGRGHLPLWDGDYLLAPVPLTGPAGRAAIDAFASICETHDCIDLVVLADPQPEFERYARERGVGFRVHFAGVAPRDAEWAWLSGASATLIAGDAPLSGGLILRALAAGCPLLAAPGGATAAPIEAWLSARGLCIGAEHESLQRRLELALESDPARLQAGRAVAAAHGLDAVADRLAAALDMVGAIRRAA